MGIALNALARRQTAASRFSHFAGPEDGLVALAADCFAFGRPGHKPGVWRVPVPVAGFYSGVILATDRTVLAAAWTRRAEGEEPFACVFAPPAPPAVLGRRTVGGKPAKTPARAVELILYRADVIDPAGSPDDWEIVSVNARATEAEEPPHPLAMARNQLGRPGGTPTDYAVADFARAVLYWGRRVFAAPDGETLTGPEYPPLTAGWVAPDQGTGWVEAYCDDPTFLPPAAVPEPPRPETLSRRVYQVTGGAKPASAAAFAEAILYWSRRPRRPSDPAVPADDL